MIVFSQFNYTKPDGFMLFYCQISLNFQGAYALIQVRSLSYLLYYKSYMALQERWLL